MIAAALIAAASIAAALIAMGTIAASVRAVVPALALAVVLGGCQPGVLDPAGAVGGAERTILLDSLAIMMAIVVPTIALALGCAWWFRKTNARARYNPDWTYSGRVELVVWGIPLLTIVLLGGVSWVGSHALDPARPLASDRAALEVQVVSLDWKWLFIYPDQGIASVNELVVPAGRPVHFALTSSSVMNAFFVPRLGSMIYTMSGMRSELNLIADQPGRYDGLSAHYSGDGFSDMRFQVRALPEDGFDGWVAGVRGGAGRLDDAAYTILARPSSKVAPSTFHDVEHGLFERVVSLAIAPAPGPPDPTRAPDARMTRKVER